MVLIIITFSIISTFFLFVIGDHAPSLNVALAGKDDNKRSSLDPPLSQNDVGELCITCVDSQNIIAGTGYIKGTNSPDMIIGSDEADIIWGMNGDDVIFGRGEADRIYGGNGDDTIEGGLGADQLFGEDGNDDLFGGFDDDLLVGGDGDDHLFGEFGNDILWGGKGADFFNCGEGIDKIMDFNLEEGDVMTGDCEIF